MTGGPSNYPFAISLQPEKLRLDSRMASKNSQLPLTLLSAAKEELQACRSEEGLVLFCKAYAMEPLLSTDHLVTLPPQVVHTVLRTLEDWCMSASPSDDLLQRCGIPLTWERICDLILSPGLAPRSRVAWSLKVKCQMQRKSYVHVVATCTEALERLASVQGEGLVFWAQRGLAYLLLEEFHNAVKDYLSAFQENPTACHAYISEAQSTYVTAIVNAFYITLAKLDTQGKTEGRALCVKLYQFIVTFSKKDSSAYGDCANHMMKLRKYNEAINLLSDGLQHVTGSTNAGADSLQLLLLRAECYLAVEEIEMALGDYVSAAVVEEGITRDTMLSLPVHQQRKLAACAKHVASDILAHCHMKSKLKATCYVDTQCAEKKLKQAAGFFRLLYLIDGHHVDALHSSADCYRMLGDFSKAIKLYSQFLLLRPRTSKAYYARALCYRKCGDMQSALSDYNTSLNLHPNLVQALCGRACLFLATGKPRKAVADLAAASALSKELSACCISELVEEEQVSLKAKLKDYLASAMKGPKSGSLGEEALGVCDILTLAWPVDVDCHLFYADLLMSLRKTDEAQAVLVRLQRNTPGHHAATVHLAALRMTQGKIVSALEDLFTVAKTYGEEKLKEALLNVKEEQRSRITREAHCEGVQRMNASPMYPDAETYFTIAVAAAPSRAWESYFWRAKVRWQLGQTNSVLADCTSALEIKENCAEVLCWRAFLSIQSNLRGAYLDFLKALLINASALKSFVLSRDEKEKCLLLGVLTDCAQNLFLNYIESGMKSKCIIPLCRLLIHLQKNSSSHHSMYADALIIHGDCRRAAAELDIAERLCPEDISVLCRSSLVRMRVGHVDLCIDKLCLVAQGNPEYLEFTFKAFNRKQKELLAAESISRALFQPCEDRHALLLYSVAVVATEGHDADVLCMRAKCLERLQYFKRAIQDLSAVISLGPRLGDVCARANLHLLDGNLKAACVDFISAMEMHEVGAINFISSCPGKEELCEVFRKAAANELRNKRYMEGLKICSYGLRIDPSNAPLRRLKFKLEFGVNKCILQ